LTEQHDEEAVEQPAASNPVSDLLSGWGRGAGTEVAGWTCRSVDETDVHGVARVTFDRGDHNVEVRLQRAGDEPCFVRIGDVALSYTKVDSDLETDAGDVVVVIAEWLNRHDEGVELARILLPAPLEERGDAAAEPQGGESESGEPEGGDV